MPSFVSPKKNTAFEFYVGLVSQANTKIMQASPTFAAGDVKVSTDNGTSSNITTLPVIGTNTKLAKVNLSAAEMNGDNVTVTFSDAAGAEWCDLVVNIQTSARQIDDLSTVTTAQVNTEVLDVLNVDTFSEPASVPAATSTLRAKIGWLFLLARNTITQTSTTQLVKADDASTTVGTSTVSDDGSVFTRGEYS